MSSRSHIPAPAHEAGELVHGFRIQAVTPLEDIKALAYEATHEPTGAQVLHIHCHDEENMFSVGFRTPPKDSTGVAHILEHSVLAGSERFPVKDAFNELGKRTLNTFLNAMTWPDRTVYPVCSTVRQDFFNLAAVYADLVFNPLLKRETFMQEGHHLELEDLDDPASPLTVSGVVYNEMKGVYSSPEELIYRELQRTLMPDTIYGHDSGGDPDVIPDLTYEQLRDFHHTFYSPSNARFLLYGGITLNDNLAFLANVLQPFERIEVDSTIPHQPRWDAPRQTEIPYPVSKEEPLDKKTFVTLSWLTNDTSDMAESLLLDIALDAIIGSAAGPLYRALTDSKLGEAVFGGGYSADIQQSSVHIGLRGTERDRADKIEALILETLRKIVDDGLDPELIEAVFHQTEFAGREIVPPFPIRLLYRANRSWFFDGDPKEGLEFGRLVEQVRARYAEEPRLFENIIQRWLLDNNHRMRLSAYPSPTLADERDATFRERMAEKKATLDDDDIHHIVTEAKTLKAKQEEGEDPDAIATLPKLEPADVPNRVRTIPTTEGHLGEVAYFEHPVFSNGIGYIHLAFDMRDIDDDLTRYLPMFCRLTRGLGAAGLSYDVMARRIDRHTGGISLSPTVGRHLSTRDRYEYLVVSVKMLPREVNAAVEVLQDLLLASETSEHQRINDLVRSAASRASSGMLVRSGHSFAASWSSAQLDPTLWRSEQWSGITQVKFIRELAQDVDAQVPRLADTVARLQQRLFTRTRLTVDAAGDPDVLDALRPALQRLVDALPEGTPVTPADEAHATLSKHTGIVIPAQVNYVTLVMPVPRLNHEAAPAIELLASVLSEDLLYKRIRVQGGAYGGYTYYAGGSGLMPMLSYRDPNLTETLNVFDEVLDFLRSERLNDDMVDAVRMSSISGFTRVLSPAQQIATARSRRLMGLTNSVRQAFRDGLSTVDAAAIRTQALPHIEAALANAPRTVLASREALIAANEELAYDLTLVSLD